ncbi:hypothetical protein SUDANB95_03865 [Actinosynnema sp. ALI-1.44]|uniref:AraC-type transcription regulator ligand-binding domain-containing protein n=1 Tax=Saccharothrix mutabilis subsp. mutabilis TaxID=66855 RepID=A0ABN0T423_9PSEU
MFRSRVVTVAGTRPFDPDEWRGALVVVTAGEVELEGAGGTRRAFGRGAVLVLDGLGLRALHQHGPEPAVLVAVVRTTTVTPC